MLEVVRRGRSQTAGIPEYLKGAGYDPAKNRSRLTSALAPSSAKGSYAMHVGQTPQMDLFNGLEGASEDACRPEPISRGRPLRGRLAGG